MKHNVVGLGKCGCNLADLFARHKQYKVFKINTEGTKSKNTYILPKYDTPEEYEVNAPKLKTFFRGVKGKVLFILGGSGIISGSMLTILEQVQHCEISILYIRPDTELLSELRMKQERLTFNFLQEFALGRMFKGIILMDARTLEEIMGEIPLVGYFEKINEMIVSTLHLLNVFDNTASVMDNFSCPGQSARVISIGNVNIETGEEKLFFPLDNPFEKVYYYGINEETLKTDGQFFKKVKEQIRQKRTKGVKVSYGIYSTTYDKNYAFLVSRSSQLQKGDTNESV